MEGLLAGTKDIGLIQSLDFSGVPGIASYVQRKEQVKFFAQGGNQFSPSGVRQIRFSLNTTGGFVDLSSLFMKATVTNKAAAGATPTKRLVFLGANAGLWFQEIRVYAGGVMVDNVQYYNRTEAALSYMQSAFKRTQEFDEGFGSEVNAQGVPTGTQKGVDLRSKPIDGGESRVVCWRPKALGLCNQHLYIPTHLIGAGGLVFEMLLVNSSAEVCDTSATVGGADHTHVSDWELSNVQMLCDVIQISPEMQTSISKHILGGGSLQIPYKVYNSQLYSCTSEASQQIVMARALTRLCSFWLSFHKNDNPANETFKVCNGFDFPASFAMRMRTKLGELAFPQHEIEDVVEYWQRYLQGVGLTQSSAHHPGMNIEGFKDHAFFAYQDLEAVAGQAHASGVSTHGSQLTIELANIALNAADKPDSIFLTTYAEAIMEITADGVSFAI